MSKRVQAARPLLVGVCCVFFGCTVPPLESQFEGGPTVKEIVNHINCELKSIVNQNNPEIRARLDAESQLNPPLPYERRLSTLLNYLTKDHFVASVLMTLDVLDSQGVSPSLNFIHPLYPGTSLSTMFNVTLAVSGSLAGSQERNITLSYAVDLDSVSDKCQNPDNSAWLGLVGDLGLTTIVVDGLRGLDAASTVNIYGGSGPTQLTQTVPLDGWILTFSDSDNKIIQTSTFNGTLSFAPSTTDPTIPGTASLIGTAGGYFVSLTGSMVQDSSGSIPFSLTGNMTPLYKSDGALSNFGFSPKLTLAGTADKTYSLSAINSGQVSKDTSSGGTATTGNVTLALPPKTAKTKATTQAAPTIQGGPGPAAAVAGAGGTPAKSGGAAGASSGGATQFGSLINVIVSYGLGGGPNWTLKTFKGPSGGGGGGGSGSGSSGGGQLVNFSRTDTDTLTITFVAACTSDKNNPDPKNYWQSLPHCDKNNIRGFHAIAAGTGAANNILIQTGRGL